MWIDKLELKEFRAFETPMKMIFSKNITCISGHNGIGKSTILAALSNCGELKKIDGCHLNGSVFRGEFSDIIIGNKDFDSIGDKVKVYFKDLPSNDDSNIAATYVNELDFRAAWQQKRYRLLPKKIHGVRETESKIKWPTYYLGLSRLYPVGESKTPKQTNLEKEISDKLLKIHGEILSNSYDSETFVSSINISETSKGKAGINTTDYPATSNSSGQDNIGQIILTVLSFEKLKLDNPENYAGGILLIDELDATVHPAAQKKLFDFLLESSIELDLQIVFTTHSITLINHVIECSQQNTSEVKINYLVRRESGIQQVESPTLNFIQSDLTNTYTGIPKPKNKVKILTEDEVARWFIDLLLNTTKSKIDVDLLDINISWSHLINLMTSDVEVYKNYIAVLDPDIKKTENYSVVNRMIQGYPIEFDKEPISNIFYLPSNYEDKPNVEEMLWRYLNDIPDDHPFFKLPETIDNNWQKHILVKYGPNDDNPHFKGKHNIRVKNWFKENQYILGLLVPFWINDNLDIVEPFITRLNQSCCYFYNRINP